MAPASCMLSEALSSERAVLVHNVVSIPYRSHWNYEVQKSTTNFQKWKEIHVYIVIVYTYVQKIIKFLMVSNIFKTDQNRIIGYHQIFANIFRAFSQISRVLISDLMCLGSQLELVFLSFASSTIAAKPWDGSDRTDELSKRPPSFEMIHYVAHEIPECKENFRELLKFMKPTGS